MTEIKNIQKIVWQAVGDKQYPRLNIPADVVHQSDLTPDVISAPTTWRVSEGRIVMIMEVRKP
jgi:hypothetical protein